MRKRIIVLVTFIAGLYYLLEFLLPPRIGGAPDADGAVGATLVRPASEEAFLVYTGLRDDRRPVLLRTGADGSGPREVLIAPHFARRDDYRGAAMPQFVPPDRLYYIGYGWDDRTPRVCLARGSDDGWRPERRAVLSNGQPGEVDASGIPWCSVQRIGEGQWRMWYVGKQGDRGTLCLASSEDGLRWTKLGAVPAAEWDHASLLSVTHRVSSERTELWCVLDQDGERHVRVFTVDPADPAPRPELVRDVDVRTGGARLRDLRVYDPDGSGPLFVATLEEDGGAPLVAGLELDTESASVRLVRRQSVEVRPGPKPRTTYLSDIRGTIDDLLVVVGSFAVGLGLIGLAQVHGKRVLGLRRGWPESLAFFVAAAAMASFTVYARLNPDAGTWGTKTYNLLFYGLLQPLGSSMFSLLAAYLVSAAYRAFRVRTFEGALLAASATLIMLGQVPVGGWLTQSLPPYLQIPKVMAWVLFVSNTAVVRAVNFGIFVGALATALRVWLSMDRASMRSVE